jgi:hypothetical protein
MRRLLAVVCGLVLLGGLGVVPAGAAVAAPLLICSPHDGLRATGSGTSQAHMFYPYDCNQDPVSAGVTDIVEGLGYERVDARGFNFIRVDRGTQRSAKTELTVCTFSFCSFPDAVPPGSYRAVLVLDISGTAANGDAHCGRLLPGDPIHCEFRSGTFTLV